MEGSRRTRAGSIGYVVVLFGAITFVVGCFLPYYDYAYSAQPERSLSLYRLFMLSRGGLIANVGAFLYLFAGIATIAWVAIAGVRGRRWAPTALVATAIAWSLTEIGSLAGASRLFSPLLVGYWFLLLAVVVVVIGAIVVWVIARREVPERQTITA